MKPKCDHHSKKFIFSLAEKSWEEKVQFIYGNVVLLDIKRGFLTFHAKQWPLQQFSRFEQMLHISDPSIVVIRFLFRLTWF